MNVEYETLCRNKTWILVPRPKDKKVLTNRWVFKIKYDENGSVNKYKTRLVTRDHTRKGIDYEEVFAPVARYDHYYNSSCKL